jgi:hypothetical protein
VTATDDMIEAEWFRQVVEIAEMFGWSWAHFRPARTQRGWRTPVSGPLGAGWPDLTLVKGDRLLFVELKREKGRPKPDQVFVLQLLGDAAEVYIWRPSDFEDVARILGSGGKP